MGVQITTKMKHLFFDRPAVRARVKKDKLGFLERAGAYGRKTARNSIKRKGLAKEKPEGERAQKNRMKQAKERPASNPGSPPFMHSPNEYESLKNILFVFNEQNNGVIIGPVGFSAEQGQTVPNLHEYGGSRQITERLITLLEKVVGKGGKKGPPVATQKWVQGRGKPGQPTRNRTATYPPRPFMKPAMEKTAGKFKTLWFSSSGAS